MALILVRYGEVAIKGAGTRSRMERLLMHNIISGLGGVLVLMLKLSSPRVGCLLRSLMIGLGRVLI